MGKQQRFSRRDFLKFGAVGAAGAAAAGIVGCTPSGGATDEAKAASPAMDGAIDHLDDVHARPLSRLCQYAPLREKSRSRSRFRTPSTRDKSRFGRGTFAR